MDSVPKTLDEHRSWWEANTDQPYGLCWCGCGMSTPIARWTRADRGWVGGAPVRFVPRHHTANGPFAVEPYTVEDRGFSSPCWIWQRNKTPHGYAVANATRSGGSALVHRRYYQEKHGPLSHTQLLHHLCRQKSCVNPDHVEIVSYSDHMKRHRGEMSRLGSPAAMVWSRKHAGCVRCGTSERPHRARGLCGRCWHRAKRAGEF